MQEIYKINKVMPWPKTGSSALKHVSIFVGLSTLETFIKYFFYFFVVKGLIPHKFVLDLLKLHDFIRKMC